MTTRLSHARLRTLAVGGVAAAALAAPVAVVTSASAAPVKKANAAAVAGCQTSQLKVSLGRGNATAGTTFYPLKFVNKSNTTCTLRGYPGVSAVTAGGRQIGKPARRVSAKFRTVTLAPGKQQSASVGIVDTGNFRRSACKPVTATGLKVFPPNATKAVRLNKRFETCSSKASVSLVVRPVK